MFLKVGRPAWELNIETERLKDKINNDSDKVRATRSKKKRQVLPHEAPKKKNLQLHIFFVIGALEGRRGGGGAYGVSSMGVSGAPPIAAGVKHPHNFRKTSDFSGDSLDVPKVPHIEVS